MPKKDVVKRVDLRTGSLGAVSIGGVSGGVVTTPLETHVLATNTHLGDYHTISGATAGHVLRASSATAANFAQLAHSDLSGLTTGDPHTQYALRAIDLTAGAGLTGGGDLSANRTFAVGAGLGITVNANDVALTTPGTLTVSSSNSASGNHTHAVTASDDVSAGNTALLKSAAGVLGLGAITSVAGLSLAPTTTLTLNAGTYTILPNGKELRSTSFASGWAGNGLLIENDGLYSGLSYIEVDNLTVRGTMNVYELLIHQIRATNGSVVVANTGRVKDSTLFSGGGAPGSEYTVNTEEEHGFEVGDLIRAQQWTGTGTFVSNLEVVGVFSSTNMRVELVSGSAPQVGGDYVRLGNVSDADRQGGVYLTADDSGAPFIDVWNGIDAFADWNTAGVIKVRLGRLDGITGGTNEYGLIAGASGYTTADSWLKASTSAVTQNNITSTWYNSGNKIVEINATDGVRITSSTSFTWMRAYTFVNPSGAFAGMFSTYDVGNSVNYLDIQNTTVGNRRPQITITAAGDATYEGIIHLNAVGGGSLTGVSCDSSDETVLINGTLIASVVNGTTGINLQYNGSTKVAIVTGGANVTGALGVTGAADFDSTVNVDGVFTVNGSDAQLIRGSGTDGVLRAFNIGGAQIAAGTDYARIQFRNYDDGAAANYTGAIISSQNPGGDDTGDLRFYTKGAADGGATVRWRIDTSGNLIGTGSMYAGGEGGGVTGTVGITNATQGVSTGVGTVRVNGTTARDSTGWIKVYDGTNTRYIPFWTTITG